MNMVMLAYFLIWRIFDVDREEMSYYIVPDHLILKDLSNFIKKGNMEQAYMN